MLQSALHTAYRPCTLAGNSPDLVKACCVAYSWFPISQDLKGDAWLQRVMALSWEQKVALFRECDLYAKKMEAMFQQRSQIVASLKVCSWIGNVTCFSGSVGFCQPLFTGQMVQEVPRTVVDQKVLLRDIAAFSSTVAKLVSNSDQVVYLPPSSFTTSQGRKLNPGFAESLMNTL